MYLVKSFLCCGLLLLFVVSAKAQDDRTRFGFGVGVGMNSLLGSPGEADFSALSIPASFANFTFVVRGKNFRLEPNFGYFSYSADRDYTRENYFGEGSTYTRNQEESSSNFRVGAIIAYATAIGSTNLYYGLNIGIILSSASRDIKETFVFNGTTETETDSDKASKTDFFVGPAIGGEYMFSENFSLGGEIQINYISLGQFDWKLEEDVTKDDRTTSLITTNAIVMLRWYVN